MIKPILLDFTLIELSFSFRFSSSNSTTPAVKSILHYNLIKLIVSQKVKKSSDVQRISKLKIETLFLSWSFLDFWISAPGFVAKNHACFISIPIFEDYLQKKKIIYIFATFKRIYNLFILQSSLKKEENSSNRIMKDLHQDTPDTNNLLQVPFYSLVSANA